jgi:L-ascorbate metabolism protein UlaG (beta-lactamase superfamily)
LDITWYGYSCFRITERGHTTVVTDPHHPRLNLAKLGLKADLVTISHDSLAEQVEVVRGEKYVISGAGEYEVGELFVMGIPLHVQDSEGGKIHSNVAYHLEYPNNLNVLHLGLLHQKPDQSIIEQLDEVCALLLPVGGAGLGSDDLADLISMIEPRYVLPMQPAKVSDEAFTTALDGLLTGMGVAVVEWQDMLRVTSSGLDEPTQVIRLQPAKETA